MGVVRGGEVSKETKSSNSDQTPTADFDRKLRVARELMRNGDYFSAADLFESMQEERPDDLSLYNQLKTCYRQLSMYDKLELLIRQQMAGHPDNHRFPIDLGECFAVQQKSDPAHKAYDQALDAASDDAEILAVLASMSRSGLVDASLKIMDGLDDTTQASAAYVFERGQEYEMLKLYGKAAGEYLELLSDTGRVATNAERRIVSLLSYEPAAASVETVLVARMETVPGGGLLEILSSHFLKEGQFDVAYNLALRQDSIDGFSAQAPLRFMVTAKEQKQPEQVIRMAAWVLEHYDSSSVEVQTRFSLGEAQVKLGQYRAALNNYQTLIDRSRDVRDSCEAIYEMAGIYLDYLNQYDSALILFDAVANAKQRTQASLLSLREIPFCYLRMGDFSRAYDQFGQLRNNRAMNREDWLEEFDYYRGMIRFCEGQYDSSEVALRRLMVDFPMGFYVNDALQMVMIISRAAGNTTLLDSWGAVCRADLQRQSDSLKQALLAVADLSNTTLADLALHRLIEIAVTEGAEDVALGFVERMGEEAPESYYYPFALKTKADLLSRRPDRIDEAGEIYLQLLQGYPNYPFASEVREKLRNMHPDDEIG